jgi:hypothetical protein
VSSSYRSPITPSSLPMAPSARLTARTIRKG